MSSLVIVSVVFLTAGTVLSADYDNDSGDGLWDTATNWSDELVPATSDVRIGNNSAIDQTCTIGSGIVGLASRVRIGEDGNACTLIIDGGSLTTVGDDVRVGYSTSVGTSGTLNLLWGNMTVGKDLEIGQNGEGTFTMTTGTVLVDDDIVIGTGAAGVFNLNGGTVTQTAIYEGNGFLDIGATGLLNFGGTGLGTMVLWGDQVSTVEAYFDNGYITSDLGFIATDLTSNPGYTTVSPTAVPEPATIGLFAVFGGALMFVRRIRSRA